MSNIDLIPQAYRTRRWQASCLKYTAILLGSLAGIIMLTASALSIATANAKSRVEALQLRQTVTAQQQADLQRLGAERDGLEQQFGLLSGLRSGASAEDMFVTIDHALTDDSIWFVEWQFQRGSVMAGEEVRAANSGFFAAVAEGDQALAANDIRVQTEMTIRGQARDHSALSTFVRRLFAEATISDVRIRQTTLIASNQISTVEFDLAVVLITDVRGE